jgi:hypothetical protein
MLQEQDVKLEWAKGLFEESVRYTRSLREANLPTGHSSITEWDELPKFIQDVYLATAQEWLFIKRRVLSSDIPLEDLQRVAQVIFERIKTVHGIVSTDFGASWDALSEWAKFDYLDMARDEILDEQSSK